MAGSRVIAVNISFCCEFFQIIVNYVIFILTRFFLVGNWSVQLEQSYRKKINYSDFENLQISTSTAILWDSQARRAFVLTRPF